MCLKRKDIGNLQFGGKTWQSRCIMYCVCQALGPTKKKLEEQEHGKENPKESQEARSHQAVDHIRSLKLKSVCKFFISETIWTHQNWRKQEHGKESPKEGQEARSHQAVDHIRSLKVKSGCKHFVNQAGRASALPVFFCLSCGMPPLISSPELQLHSCTKLICRGDPCGSRRSPEQCPSRDDRAAHSTRSTLLAST